MRLPLRRIASVLVAALAAFVLSSVVNHRSLTWLWTDEVGRPLPEPLLSFWTWRLPLTCSLGLIAVGLLVALRPAIEARQAALLIGLSLLTAGMLTCRLYAATTGRTLRGIAAVLTIRPVDEPLTLLPFFNDHSDPAGVATEDPVVLARFAGCYEVLPTRRARKPVRPIRPEPFRLGIDERHAGRRYAGHPTLELQPDSDAFYQFWFVENGSAVLVWSWGLSGRSMKIRSDGQGGLLAISCYADDITRETCSPIRVERTPCPPVTPRSQPPLRLPIRLDLPGGIGWATRRVAVKAVRVLKPPVGTLRLADKRCSTSGRRPAAVPCTNSRFCNARARRHKPAEFALQNPVAVVGASAIDLRNRATRLRARLDW